MKEIYIVRDNDPDAENWNFICEKSIEKVLKRY